MAEQDVLMPLDVGINGSNGNRETEMIPTGNQDHHIEAKRIRRMVMFPAKEPQGVVLSPFVFTGAIPTKVDDRTRSQGQN